MIIFKDKTGQLGNNLFEFATFIALAKSTDRWIFNNTFEEFMPYFEGSKSNFNRNYKVVIGNKLFHKVITIFTKMIIGNNSRYHIVGSGEHVALENLILSNKLTIKSGGWFTYFKVFFENENYIRSYFTPIPIINNEVAKFVSTCKNDCDLLVGIHLRKGDYKQFLGGKFYFDDSIYLEKMKQIKELFPARQVKFLLASNEKIDFNSFDELNCILAPNDCIKDLYSFAKCDYLIGPPSTYTMWASFYGRVPLAKIRTSEQIIKLQDFKIDEEY